MSINVSNYHNNDSAVNNVKNNDAAAKKSSEIKLFSNEKVASDINSIAAKYGTANFDDAREFAALGNYIEQFKANLNSGVQRFLNGILNKSTSYTSAQIQEMASHTDKATADRTKDFAKAFDNIEPGTVEILSLLQSCRDDDEITSQEPEQIWVNAAAKTDKATADRVKKSVAEFTGLTELLMMLHESADE